MAKNSQTIASIDLGSYRCCCVIGEVTGPDRFEVLGVGTARTQGIRKGVIVNLEVLVASIRKAVEEAEKVAGRSIESAVATVPAAQTRARRSTLAGSSTGRSRKSGSRR